ncbi:MAG: lamin tail domain-containing protein, partial [Patescibacteria group bacterium]
MNVRLIFVATCLYCFAPTILHAADVDIVINEIAAYESGDYEWFEIFNKSTAAVDITGWKFYEAQTNHKLTEFRGGMVIPAGGYAIIANKADKIAEKYSSFVGMLIDSSWGTLAENGEEIGLKNASGDTVELFTYITAKKTSLERKNAGLADFTDANWTLHPDANSIGVKNSNAGGGQEEQQQQQQQQQSNSSEEQKSSPPPELRIFRPMRGDVL